MSDTPTPESGLRWHKLTAISYDGKEIEVMGATCIDGIGVIVRWKKNKIRWTWEAIDTEGGVDWSPCEEEGNEIPDEPPAVWDDAEALERELAAKDATLTEITQRLDTAESRLFANQPSCAHCRGEIGAVLTTLIDQASKEDTIEKLRANPIGWISGPARGGEGTAGSRDGVPWWWDGDLLLIVVNTRSGPEISLVRVNADGDQMSLDDPETGDDIGRTADEIAWYFKVEAPSQALTDSKS